MKKIGIDFSLNSPALCINDGERLSFVSLFNCEGVEWNRTVKPIKKFECHNSISPFVELSPYVRGNEGKLEYIAEQRVKLGEASMLASLVMSHLPENDCVVSLEGFSYNSSGSSYIDLVMYNSFLRKSLTERYGPERIFIVSPAENKKFASGNGNANKEKMIEAFLANRSNDSMLAESGFYKYLKSSTLDYKHIKPIDDLVDAYWLQRYVDVNF